ncbi:MAG: hypothetical protein KAJ10_10220 [Thermodesulfovibrionia bacterium]|nr:hypothetical protein [Thermodesulfovibrionia bacterium]
MKKQSIWMAAKKDLIRRAKAKEAKSTHRDIIFGDDPDVLVFPEGVKPEVQEDFVLNDNTISSTELQSESEVQTAI